MSYEQYVEAAQLLANRRIYSLGEEIFFPTRTNTWQNLCKDFFFPVALNCAIKIDHFALRIFSMISAGLFDLISFPVRCITVLPRMAYNSLFNGKETHPFYVYLKDHSALESDLQELDHVFVNIQINGQNYTCRYIYFVDYPIADIKFSSERNFTAL